MGELNSKKDPLWGVLAERGLTDVPDRDAHLLRPKKTNSYKILIEKEKKSGYPNILIYKLLKKINKSTIFL